MANALLTGVSGLVAHQRMLEVVGNNLANLNTAGYKSQRIRFADQLYEMMRPATSPTDGVIGGTNPSQVGAGVSVAQIDRNVNQGALQATGRSFDFAIEGEGFFAVDNGIQTLYTRAGAFDLDANLVLVEPGKGYRVLRFGTVGEPDGVNPGFQEPGNPEIRIPLGTSIPGDETTSVLLKGNLDANLTPPLQEVLLSKSAYTTGGSAASTTTLLNDLDANSIAYVAGDVIDILGSDADGTPVNSSLAVDGTTTMGDLINAINAAFPGATASLDASGFLHLTASNPGPAALTLILKDNSFNAGRSAFPQNPVLIQGKGADSYGPTLDIFDVRGGRHELQLNFTKVDYNTWDLNVTMNAAEGSVIDGSVQQITFNEDGSFQQVRGTGVGDPAITVLVNGISTPQTIQFDFGQPDSFDALTHLATGSTIDPHLDGREPGTLTGVRISASAGGIIEGIASNSKTFPLAQLAVASFRNPAGLTARGDNYYEQSQNSGPAVLGAGGSANRGVIRAQQLESSNVDLALEFTRLIVAQRGFSANARTITVSDEVLEELTNVIR